jgi:hypothetical protein
MNMVEKAILAALSFLWFGSVCQAQDLPKGEELIEKYLQATGGRDAYAKLKNRVSMGTVELTGLNKKGTITIFQAVPNLFLMEMILDDLGMYRQGCNGNVAWEFFPDGVHIKEGKEKAIMLRTTQFNSDLNWRQVFSRVESVKDDTLEGKTAFKVACTTLDGDVLNKYYDKATSLALKSQMRRDKVESTTLVSDYRKVDGILLPHRIVDKLGGNQTIINLTKIEHNVNLPVSKFDLPAEVKKKLESPK